jgi:hypothetical protein
MNLRKDHKRYERKNFFNKMTRRRGEGKNVEPVKTSFTAFLFLRRGPEERQESDKKLSLCVGTRTRVFSHSLSSVVVDALHTQIFTRVPGPFFFLKKKATV